MQGFKSTFGNKTVSNQSLFLILFSHLSTINVATLKRLLLRKVQGSERERERGGGWGISWDLFTLAQMITFFFGVMGVDCNTESVTTRWSWSAVVKAAVDADRRGAHMLSQHWILEDYSHLQGP